MIMITLIAIVVIRTISEVTLITNNSGFQPDGVCFKSRTGFTTKGGVAIQAGKSDNSVAARLPV